MESAMCVGGTILTIGGFRTDDRVALLFCLGIAWCAFAYVCYVHEGHPRKRLAIAFLMTVLLCGIGYRIYSRQLNDEQEDAFNHLDIKMVLPLDKYPWHSVAHVFNGGHERIRSHEVSCDITLIVMGGGNGGIRDLTFDPEVPAAALEAGGDEDTNSCFSGITSDPVDCFDVDVSVVYVLDTQPEVKKSKKRRFVATRPDFEWLAKPLEAPRSYCDVFEPPKR
jgi:hypothetical protein